MGQFVGEREREIGEATQHASPRSRYLFERRKYSGNESSHFLESWIRKLASR